MKRIAGERPKRLTVAFGPTLADMHEHLRQYHGKEHQPIDTVRATTYHGNLHDRERMHPDTMHTVHHHGEAS